MRLIPLGAGNCQFVYRIDHDAWTSRGPSTGPWSHCSVLKITRKADSSMLMRRILYHDEFSLFMQEACHNKSETCTPRRVCCAIDRKVAKQLRIHLSKLLEYEANGDNYSLEGKRTLFHNGVIYKKHICHIKEVEQQTSLYVEPESISIIDGIHGVYDPRRHELAILEEDMFNLAVCVSLGRTLVKSGIRDYRNISIELKPKCGLLNFSGMPSLFQMFQPYKSRIRYHNIIPTVTDKTCMMKWNDDTEKIEFSRYSPLKFFRMRLEDVKRELLHLSQTPQNNIRIFVDNIEVDPLLLSHDNYALETVAACLVENKTTVERILKIQALASGQQFVSHVINYITKMISRISLKGVPYDKTKIYSYRGSSIAKNIMCTSQELLSLIICNEASKAYDVQRLFNLIGRRLICTLCKCLPLIFEQSGLECYTSRTNLSINRLRSGCTVKGRETNEKSNWLLRRELALHSQGKVYINNSVYDEAVKLVMFGKLERLLMTMERSKYPKCFVSSKRFKLVKSHTGLSKQELRAKRTVSSIVPQYNCCKWQNYVCLMDVCNRWIELYLGGRTAMDLSIILNVLFHNKGSKSEMRVNFFRFSLIDLDLKPAERIPRWKDDILRLVLEQKFI
ncbi:hypothetical protein BgAZ_102630 [Babesia gibsoni]|uniref:Inositol-pentakisphosphate 2-kinase n=1 Tax=Babesia gibsoni TaxID=33632 RepID=A0AAD8UTQ5_BABGI|nr:hypothetical protein BgAZ_102630 [Babesia gibsoni]